MSNNNITYSREGVSRKPFNSANINTTTKIIPPKILVISYDEDRKRFLIYQGNYMFRGTVNQALSQNKYLNKVLEKITELKPDLVVCCTQNSLSCTEDHFQHYFKDLITKELRKKENPLDYSLISKADATTENDSSFWSCSTKISNNSKDYNVRTRVYRNDYTLESNLTDKNISEKSVSKKFNKKSKYDEWYAIRFGPPSINKFYVEHIGFRRITETSKGIGGIMYDVMICKKPDNNNKPTCFQNIFCNYNLKPKKEGTYNLGDSSTRILNGMATSNMFKKENNSKLKNELQIFMITPDTVKTRHFFKDEIENILINNNTQKINDENINVTRRKQIIGKNVGTMKFKRINTTKITNNVKQKEYEAIKGKNKILKKIKMFNTTNLGYENTVL